MADSAPPDPTAPPPTAEAKGKRGQGSAWAALEGLLGACLSLGSAVVLAAILGPSEVGTAAVALAVLMIVNLPLARLFPDALVQRPELSDRHAGSAAWVALGLGLLAAASLGFGARPLARLLGHEEAAGLIAWLALTCPCTALGGVAQGLLLRRRRLRRMAAATLLPQAVATGAGIVAAVLGAGPGAMALQYGLAHVLALPLLAASGAVPLGRRFGRAEALDLLRVGLPGLGAQALHQGRLRLFLLLAAGRLDPAGMGALHLGYRLVDAARDVAAGIVQRLALPALSRAQGSAEGFALAYARASRITGLVVLPPFAGLALTAQGAVAALLGAAWAQAVPVVALNAALAVVVLARLPSAVALTATGRTGAVLRIQLVLFGLTLAACLAVPFDTPAEAALVWFGASLLGAPIGFRILAKRLALGLAAQFRPLWPASLALLGVVAGVLVARHGLPAASPWVAAASPGWRLALEAVSGALGAALLGLPFLLGTPFSTRPSVLRRLGPLSRPIPLFRKALALVASLRPRLPFVRQGAPHVVPRP